MQLLFDPSKMISYSVARAPIFIIIDDSEWISLEATEVGGIYLAEVKLEASGTSAESTAENDPQIDFWTYTFLVYI